MSRAILAVLLSIGVMTFWLYAETIGEETDKMDIKITKPERDGARVGRYVMVEGTAKLPAGHHLWVFARLETYDPFWWIQGEGRIDPESGECSARSLGAPACMSPVYFLGVPLYGSYTQP